MDLKKEWKEFLVLTFGIVLIVWIGIIVVNNGRIEVNHDLPMIEKYCIDKIGEQNIEHLELLVIDDNSWNCSRCNNGKCYVKLSGVI